MKKRDIILFGIVGILIVQGVLINKFMNSGQGARVEVYVENKLYNTYPLDKDQKINIKEKNGRINNIHIHTGFIDKPGQSIVCLPHKINIKISSDDDSQIDKDVIVK